MKTKLELLRETAEKLNHQIKDLEQIELEAKPTLTPISFASKEELVLALLHKRLFKVEGHSGILRYDGDTNHHGSPFRYGEAALEEFWEKYDNLLEINAAPKEEWYHNIPPEGVACWVSDKYLEPDFRQEYKVIMAYDPSERMPFLWGEVGGSRAHGFRYATPYTKVRS
jgi:hypothetical protein